MAAKEVLFQIESIIGIDGKQMTAFFNCYAVLSW